MSREWSPDTSLESFESTTLALPAEDDGQLVATIVRRNAVQRTSRAVLYIHGFVDYFFQAHLAEAFNNHGYNFYAIDLRRYGRSLRAGNRPNYCRDIAEYDAEITSAIDIMRLEDGNETLLLMGHSTGGLIASLYAHRGERREDIHGLILNSPFFGFHVSPIRRAMLPMASVIGRVIPFLAHGSAISPMYAESLLDSHNGEWSFDTRWKPVKGFPAYLGWISAIRRAHKEVAEGLTIECPILVMHSSKSVLPSTGDQDKDEYGKSDIVLDVAHMREASHRIGKRVTVKRIEHGVHDLFLSREEVRDKALQQLFAWIASTIGEKQVTVREFTT